MPVVGAVTFYWLTYVLVLLASVTPLSVNPVFSGLLLDVYVCFACLFQLLSKYILVVLCYDVGCFWLVGGYILNWLVYPC